MGRSGGSSRHVELELKFDVPADLGDAAVPSFDGLSGVSGSATQPTQWLEALYYDTADLDLARHRVTLRRRTGGADEGWHLKLPGSAGVTGARTEIRTPLHADVPDELRDTVLAIVRDRPLAAVARISTARDVTTIYGADGGALAEFCDDHVTACRLRDGNPEADHSWREWELELIDAAAPGADGLLSRLANRLTDVGAVGAGHVSKLAKTLGDVAAPVVPADPLHRAVAEQIARLLESDRAVRADADDAVHQMRVATRQIRSLLQASAGSFGLSDDAWILRELRELAAILGVARDAEVLAERYTSALNALPDELVRGPVAERLARGPSRRHHAALRPPDRADSVRGRAAADDPGQHSAGRSPRRPHPGGDRARSFRLPAGAVDRRADRRRTSGGSKRVNVTLNDEEVQVEEGITVSALLDDMGLPDRGVAVAVNWVVLPRSQWGSAVPAGARVEVVTAVQGG